MTQFSFKRFIIMLICVILLKMGNEADNLNSVGVMTD